MGLVKMKHKQVVILVEHLSKLNQNTFGEGLQHGFAKTACMKLVESVSQSVSQPASQPASRSVSHQAAHGHERDDEPH